MSLDWKWTNENWKTLREHGWQEVGIWSTLQTTVGRITPDTLPEWKWRIRFSEALGQGLADSPFPEELVEHMIGLQTNVFPTITRNQFVKNCLERWTREHKLEKRETRVR